MHPDYPRRSMRKVNGDKAKEEADSSDPPVRATHPNVDWRNTLFTLVAKLPARILGKRTIQSTCDDKKDSTDLLVDEMLRRVRVVDGTVSQNRQSTYLKHRGVHHGGSREEESERDALDGPHDNTEATES
jgi:hypothetical protein